MYKIEKEIQAIKSNYQITQKEVFEKATKRMERLSSKGFIKQKPFEIDIHGVSGYGGNQSVSNAKTSFMYQI